MAEIIDFESELEKRLPHKVSEVICVRCGKRVICVRPVGARLKDLECSGCGQTGYIIETGEEMGE